MMSASERASERNPLDWLARLDVYLFIQLLFLVPQQQQQQRIRMLCNNIRGCPSRGGAAAAGEETMRH